MKKFREFGYLIFSHDITPMLKAFHDFEKQIKSTEYALVTYQCRRQALWHLLTELFEHQIFGLAWGLGRSGVLTEDEIFTALFISPEWRENHDSSELGWWLSKYLQPSFYNIISESFGSKAEALVWMFLGAHNWFRRKMYIKSVHCCSAESGWRKWSYWRGYGRFYD